MGLGLDHDPDQGLGPRRADQHPAPVPQPGLLVGDRVPDGGGALQGVAVGDPDVDQDLGKAAHDRGQLGQGAAGAGDHAQEVEAGEEAVAGGGAVEEDEVAGLLAAQGVAAGAHGLEDVAVADGGLGDGDAVAVHGLAGAEVGHDGGDDRVGGEVAAVAGVQGADGQDDVAVDQGAVLVDGQEAVGVAVVGQADAGPGAGQGGLDVLGVGRTDAGVDVVAVGVGGHGGDLGPGAAVGLGGDLGGGPIGAVDHHLQAVQVGDALQQVDQVGLDGVVGRGTQAADVGADGPGGAVVGGGHG